MSAPLAAVLALLAAAIAMFALNRPRMDAVALLMLTLLPLTGALEMSEAVAGFSDPNIVLIAALFVIGDGLVRTGVARWLGDWLTRTAGSNENRLVALLMAAVCGLGATMSSTAVTAIFIPVGLRISQSTRTPPGRLMMPLSFAALISGMMTLVATAPNLVVNSELMRHGATGFRFFSFTPFGAPVLLLGIGYMLLVKRWLPAAPTTEIASSRPRLADWIEQYQLAGREQRVRVGAASSLVGLRLEELRSSEVSGASLVAIERKGRVIQPTPQTEILAGDVLLVDLPAKSEQAAELRRRYDLEAVPLSGAYFSDRSQDIGMAEAMVPASSEFLGQTVVEAQFRARYGLSVIGLRRGGAPVEGPLLREKLNLGDTLLLIGPWRALRTVPDGGRDLVLLNLPAEDEEVLPVTGRAPHALACLALLVVLMVSEVVPNLQAALFGCLLMGALGCVTLNSAYRSIDWKTIVLIVGMLPFSIALQRTGGVDLASEALMAVTGNLGPRGVLAALFAITALLGMFISNTATAVLMAPVALAVADELSASPYPFAMIVALAASTAFMTPVSSPVNTLVVTPGNYRFGDFVRIGVPFSLIVMAVSVALVPWLLPL